MQILLLGSARVAGAWLARPCGWAEVAGKAGGPTDGILTRFQNTFEDLEVATHIRAAEVRRELGWGDAA